MPQSLEGSRTVLRLDPWMADFEGAIQIDAGDDSVSGQVDTAVETGLWNPIAAPSDCTAPALYFIDGVRRTEARVLAWKDGAILHGLFGTVASGAVLTRAGKAGFERCIVRRVLLIGGGHAHTETVSAGNGQVAFEGVAAQAETPAEVSLELQELMRQAEAEVAGDALKEKTPVFIDGPLAYVTSLGPAIGVIKRISLPYLDAPHFALVSSLATSERTPLFLISDRKRDRYSWYLRIGARREFDHELTGIVRLELRAAVGLDTARYLAGLSAGVLPRFASASVRDPRAPQNLVPIGALEQELRRRMGDPLLIRRAIEKRISEGVEL